MRVQCNDCKLEFTRLSSLERHKRHVHNKGDTKTFSCRPCGKEFGRKENFLRHQRDQHGAGGQKSTACPMCGRVSREDYLRKHKSTCLRKALKSPDTVHAPIYLLTKSAGTRWTSPITQDLHKGLIYAQYSTSVSINRGKRLTFMPYNGSGAGNYGSSDSGRMMVRIGKHWTNYCTGRRQNSLPMTALSDIQNSVANGIATKDINDLTRDLRRQGERSGTDGNEADTFLKMAIAQGDLRAARRLVDMSFSWSEVDDRTLRIAARNHEFTTVSWLLGEAPPHTFAENDLLDCLSENLTVKLLSLFLGHGLEPNDALLVVCRADALGKTDGPNMLALLIEAGADLDHGDGEPLRIAFGGEEAGSLESMAILLDMGAKADAHIDTSPFQGANPLQVFDFRSKLDLIEQHAARQGVFVEWLAEFANKQADKVEEIWNMVVYSGWKASARKMESVRWLTNGGLSPHSIDNITVGLARETAQQRRPVQAYTMLALAVDNGELHAALSLAYAGFSIHSRFEEMLLAAWRYDDDYLMRLFLRLQEPFHAKFSHLAPGIISKNATLTGPSLDIVWPREGSHPDAALLIASAGMTREKVSAILQSHAISAPILDKALCIATEYGNSSVVDEILQYDSALTFNTSELRAALDRAWHEAAKDSVENETYLRRFLLLKVRLFLRHAQRHGLDSSWLEDYKERAENLCST